MKSVCLINGSLRGKEASSLVFLHDIIRRLPDGEYNKTIITVKARLKDAYPEEMLKKMTSADAIILVFPLYTYGLPGALMRLLEDYYQYIKTSHEYNKEAKVYLIVNCAYPRPEITGESIRVIKNLCRRLSLNWRFAVCIGTGPMVVMTKKIPFLYFKLKKAYVDIVSDISGKAQGSRHNYLIKPVIPESIITMIKKYYERKGHLIEQNQKPPQAELRGVSPMNG